ncbi:MAG: glycosyl transferase family protein [uncultured bacterium]|nr:MAG: glycosyl transferase family protein [uncultured bacterium]
MNFFHKPLVSVVLASYNHARFIKQAVESVLNQTMSDFELLVFDDGSNDGTPEVVEKIHDKRLRLIKLNLNRRFHPRNTGIKMAKGKYIAFQNSDDVWLQNKLKQQVEFMEKNKQTSVCFTRLEMIDEKGKVIKNSWAHKNLAGENKNNDAWLRLLFTSGFNFGVASALARTDKVIKLGGFNESMVQMADYDLWVRLAGLGQIHIINEPLTKMRIVKGVNFSRPIKEVYLRSTLENVDILNRYTQWPVNQYLSNIFPEIIPKDNKSANIQYAALARFAWSIKTPHHSLFADQLIAKLLNDSKASKEILEYFGANLKKEFIKQRGKLKLINYE